MWIILGGVVAVILIIIIRVPLFLYSFFTISLYLLFVFFVFHLIPIFESSTASLWNKPTLPLFISPSAHFYNMISTTLKTPQPDLNGKEIL